MPETRGRAGPTRYRPVDAMRAARFTGIGTFMRLPNIADMTGVDAAFIGIPFDTAVSYRIGGRFGPRRSEKRRGCSVRTTSSRGSRSSNMSLP